ncbi:MAG: class I SAM-dependent methyltransferase [Ruminococcaceae bacterium]|nr:class I SAM-dependent methyltransferase [Oscillospiraceae bacterium]
MKETPIPFWEKSYRETDTVAFSLSPNPTIQKYESFFPKDGHILDVGCGEGQNAIYLAGRGFSRVEAFDLSEAGIAKTKLRARQADVSLHAFPADLCTFEFDRPYDLIYSFGTLHFVAEADWREFIYRAKANTLPGGIHIMHIFTDQVPITPDLAPFAIGLAANGAIRDCYADWNILEFSSYVFEDEHPHMPLHYHSANKLVARKPLS